MNITTGGALHRSIHDINVNSPKKAIIMSPVLTCQCQVLDIRCQVINRSGDMIPENI